MKRAALAGLLVCMVFGASQLFGQDKEKSAEASKTPETQRAGTPLRVQVIFNEYDGDKKISSLPYTLLVNADGRNRTSMRMGLRVPIEISSNTGVKQIQYQDVGTNLDGTAQKADADKFILNLQVEKSSVYVPGSAQKSASIGGNEISNSQPIIQQFRIQGDLLVRDGQTVQSTAATDPVTGHILKLDVTVNVVK
jgi:Bacterial type II and III secretion system protein